MKTYRIGSLLLAAMLVCLLGISAAASDEHAARQPDYSKKGSISVTIQNADKTPMSGGTITLYEAAKAVEEDGDHIFVLTDAFASSGADLTDLETAGLAEKLSEYTAGAEGQTAELNSDGTATFTGLELGLYLLVQETPAEGYEAILPFLVTVPFWDGEKLIYDVDATPKPVAAKPELSPSPTPSPSVTPAPTPKGKLPNTGLLWWPVALLLGIGLVCVIVGLASKRGKTR